MSRRSNESAIGAIVGGLIVLALIVAFVVYIVPVLIIGGTAAMIYRTLANERRRKQKVLDLPAVWAQEYILDAEANRPLLIECKFCEYETENLSEHTCPRCRAPLPSRRVKTPSQEEALSWAQERMRGQGISLETPLGVRARVIGGAILLAVTVPGTAVVWYDIAQPEPSVAVAPARTPSTTPLAEEAVEPNAPAPTAAPEKKASRTKRSRTRAAKASAADDE